MLDVSSDIEQEIRRRIASGKYGSADELLRVAFRALDNSREAAQTWLEDELLKGLEGQDVEMTADDWANIRREAERAAGVKSNS